MNVTAGIGMVWVRLRHLSLWNTSMCAHSCNGHSEKGGRREEMGETKRERSLASFIPSHLDQLMYEDSHYPIYFRQTQFHLSSGFLPFTLKQFSVALEARGVWTRR